MTEPRKLHVFLCHASQDKLVVRELYQRLLAEGWIDPWLDEEKLLPGHEWDMEIEQAVGGADAVIVFVSNNSVTKEGYVQKELRSVLDVAEYKPEGAIFIIPILLESCQLPRRLKNYQYQDYFTDTALAYRRLIASLESRSHVVGIDFAKIKESIQREKQERLKKEKEEQIRKEAEERIRLEEEDTIRRIAEEKARKALERKLRKQADEKARQEREEQERKAADEKARLAAEESARKAEEEKERKIAEEKARQLFEEFYRKTNYAIQLERDGKLGAALYEYYEVKNSNPTYPKIDEKIAELEEKIHFRDERVRAEKIEQERKKKAQLDAENRIKFETKRRLEKEREENHSCLMVIYILILWVAPIYVVAFISSKFFQLSSQTIITYTPQLIPPLGISLFLIMCLKIYQGFYFKWAFSVSDTAPNAYSYFYSISAFFYLPGVFLLLSIDKASVFVWIVFLAFMLLPMFLTSFDNKKREVG